MQKLQSLHSKDIEAKLLSKEEVNIYLKELNGWDLEDDTLKKEFSFNDFKEALEFVNTVGRLAETEGHHPDIDIRYNKVAVGLSTHDVGGLSLKDMILATKINMVD